MPHAETLRFRFDRVLGEYADEERVAKDMLFDIERALLEEKLAHARVAGDFQQMQEIARRKQELRK